jgi:hypothetical protein
MPANKNAGEHPSYEKLNWSPSSISRKKAYDKKYHQTKERKKYRAELNKANRKAGTYGNGDGKDMSHTKSGKLVLELSRINRARNGKSGSSKK